MAYSCGKGKFKKILQKFQSKSEAEKLKKGFLPHLNQPLHYAAGHGDLEVVRSLIEDYKCDPDCQNKRGVTPLHCACYYGCLNVVKYLINEVGCDPQRRDVDGVSPLVYCAYCTNLYSHRYEPLSDAHMCVEPNFEHMKVAFFLASTYQVDKSENLLCLLILPFCCGSTKDLNCLSEILNLDIKSELSLNPINYLKEALSYKRWEVAMYLLTTYLDEIIRDKHTLQAAFTNYLFSRVCHCGEVEIIAILLKHNIYEPDACSLYYALCCATDEVKLVIAKSLKRSLVMEYIGDRYDTLLSFVFELKLQNGERNLELMKLFTCNGIGNTDEKGNTPLHLACKYEIEEIVEFLIKEKKCHQNLVNKAGQLPLHIACECCSNKIVHLLISCIPKVCVNKKDFHGDTALHIACKRHCYSICHLIHKRCMCNLNIQNNEGELPLHIVIQYYGVGGDLEMWRKLLHIVTDDTNLNINAQNKTGNTPLHLACLLKGIFEVASFLMSKFNCDLNVADGQGNLPLHNACERGSSELVKIVGDRCTLLHHRNSSGLTPLHVACNKSNLDAVKYLVFEKGCKPSLYPDIYKDLQIHVACQDAKDIQLLKMIATKENVNKKFNSFSIWFCHQTPLHIACRESNNPAIILLKKLGCDTSLKDSSGNLPLHYACSHSSLDSVKLLSPISIDDINCLNPDKNSPFHLACKSGAIDVVKYMINQGLLPTKDAGSALACACGLFASGDNSTSNDSIGSESKRVEVIKFLVLEHGYDPSLSFKRNCSVFLKKSTPVSLFDHVCESNTLELMKALTIQSNYVNIIDGNGNTPLHYACKWNRYDIVKYLVEQECDQTIQNHQGNFALHIACKSSLEIVQLLTNNDKRFINSCNVSGNTPLMIAIKSEKNCIVQYLVCTLKCDVSIKNAKGETAYHVASQNSLEVLKIFHFTSSESDINCQNLNGDTPLHVACVRRKYDIIEYLLDNLSCKASIANTQGDFPLHTIFCHRIIGIRKLDFSICVMKMILKRYPTAATISNDNGVIPLQVICKTGNINALEAFMDSIENCLDFTDSFGNTLLHVACSHCKIEVVQWLVNHGAKSGVQNKDGNLPHHILFDAKDHKGQSLCLEIHKILGVSNFVHIQNNTGNTILHLACRDNLINMLLYMLHSMNKDYTALTIQNSTGDTPLHIAAKTIQTHLKLRTIKANYLNVKNKDGNTPLHIACKFHNLKFATSLVGLQCSPVVFNTNKELPLHMAATHSLPLVKLVTSSSKHINSRNIAGDTPLHIACQKEKLDIVCYFVNELTGQSDKGDIFNDDEILPFHLLYEKPCAELNHEYVGKYTPDLPIVDIMGCNGDGDSLLHIACKNEDPKTVSFLIVYLKSYTNVQNKVGATPLHYACVFSSLEVVKLVSDCNPRLKVNNNISSTKFIFPGDTPLHVACRGGKTEIVEYLLTTSHREALTEINEYGNLPIHVACASNIKMVKAIARFKEIFDWNATNLCEDTALHIACKGRKNLANPIISFLVNEIHCECSISNKCGDFPLHIACKNLNGEAIKALTTAMDKNDLNKKNNTGSTPLHEYLGKPWGKRQGIGALKLLVDKMGEGVSISNSNGELPIHLACRNLPPSAIRCLKSQLNSTSTTTTGNTVLHESCRNINRAVLNYVTENFENFNDAGSANQDGDIPLHIACRLKSLEAVKCLVDITPNINLSNKYLNSPLHELYMPDLETKYKVHYYRREILKVLLPKGLKFSTQNTDKETPLHCICKFGECEDMKLIVASISDSGKLNACIPDANGNTVLHLACQRDDHEMVKILLQSTQVDPSLMNKQGQTPIMLASHHETMKSLIEHGADPQPLYKLHHNFFQMFSLEKPPSTPVKVLAIGHPSVGKTTLTLLLKNKGDSTLSLHTGGPTAGVVPVDIDSEIFGTVTVYDFAGQPEYYASHDAVIHCTLKNSPPIILILVNLRDQIQIIMDQIHFWCNFISNRCALLTDKAHLILIGSHADVLEANGKSPSDKMEKLLSMCKPVFQTSPVDLKGCLHMNCTQPDSTKLHEIQMLLKQSTSEIQQDVVMHFNSHCFYVLLLQLFKDKHVTFGQIISTIEQMKNKPNENPALLLQSDIETVLKICEELDDKGHIMFIKHPHIINLSWIILNKEILLNQMLGSLFAPSGFTEQFLSCSTGVVPMSQLKEHFGSDSNMLITFLTKMEFCREIHDKAVLGMITDEKSFSSSEKYFFFPNFVSHERPIETWTTECSRISYRCGWLLQCSREGDLFNAHFIQTLLLRVAFAFALKPPEYDSSAIEKYADDDNGEENPILDLVLKRMCSLWKNGIHWQERTGVDAIVDVVGQRTLLLLMQCPHGSEVQLIRRRSQIITMVLEAKKELCSKTKLLECFIHPQSVTHPLVQFESCVMFSLPSISDSVTHHQKHVVEHTKSIKIEDLLLFEPYSEITTYILKQLFNEANSTKPVPDDIIFALADQLQHRYSFFDDSCHFSDRLCSVKSSHSHPTSEREITRKLTKLLKQLKRSPGGVNFKDLRELLDQFSIYGGRQPPQGISKML